jgi:hypothetical protein
MPRFKWINLDGSIYGTIPGDEFNHLTFRITFYGDRVDGGAIFDRRYPSDGWKHVVSVQHFRADEPNYFPPWKADNSYNNEGAIELISRHFEFLFREEENQHGEEDQGQGSDAEV